MPKDDAPVFKPSVKKTPHGVVTMPNAGYARQEELKKRADQLQERIETVMPQGATIDPSAMELDPEIMEHFDGLEVTNKEPGFVYRWVTYDAPRGNPGLWVKHAQRVGWQTVCGDMPENKENEIAGGLRKIGDCILMRIPQAKYDALVKQEELLNLRRQAATHSELAELGKRKGVIIRTPETDPALLKTMSAQVRGDLAAEVKFTQALKDGSLGL